MKELANIKTKKFDKNMLKANYNKALQDETFLKLRNNLKMSDDELMKYTSSLEDSCNEIKNCASCKNLHSCKNVIEGCVYYPSVDNNRLIFSYEPCKYQKKEQEENYYLDNIYTSHMPTYVKEACFKGIYIDDKVRTPIIKYIKNYYDKFFTNKEKGLYLSGNFGSGKTYIVASLFNELAKKDVKSSIIYFPEFLRDLKTGFDDNSYQEKFDKIKKSPLLLLDDIGAEAVTPWSRDEILGSILQYRMEENLPTFLTSNLTIEELEKHLSTSSNKVEVVKARRIIERIKYLTNEMTLISIDRRK